jgi:general stress protein 26
MKHELERLYSHIADIEIAMMTTRRADGHLQSRAMATQKRALGADLWFVTLDDADKLRDLRQRSAHQPVVLQGPYARMGIGIGTLPA